MISSRNSICRAQEATHTAAVRKHGGELVVLVHERGSFGGHERDPSLLAAKDQRGARVFQLAWASEPDHPWVVAEDVDLEPAAAAAR